MTSLSRGYDYTRLRRRSLVLFALGGVLPAVLAVGTTVYAAKHAHSWFIAVLPVLFVLAPLPFWVRLHGYARRSPARLVAIRFEGLPAFAAPPAPWSAGPLAANCVLIGVGVVWGNTLWLVLATGEPVLKTVFCFAALLVSGPLLACAYWLLTVRWRIVLRASEIRIPRLLVGHRRLAWEQLVAGRVALDTQVFLGTRPSGWVTFHPGVAAIHPEFLAEVIAYYVEHPEFRPEIGRPGEQDRMIRSLLHEREPLPTRL
jgi:hypothetical protein